MFIIFRVEKSMFKVLLKYLNGCETIFRALFFLYEVLEALITPFAFQPDGQTCMQI